MYKYETPALLEVLFCPDPIKKIAAYFYAHEKVSKNEINVPRFLYHYCPYDSFEKIIKSHSLWLSSSANMNDPMETKLFLKELSKEIDHFNKRCENKIDKKVLFTLIKVNFYCPFLFCLSDRPDMLDQWKAYGAACKGIMIGFDTAAFPIGKGLPAYIGENDYKRNSSFLQIDYETKQQKAENYNILKKISRNEIDYSSAALFFSKIATLYKSKQWKSEREWRFFYTPTNIVKDDGKCKKIDGNFYISDIKYRQNEKRGKIPYYEMNFPKNSIGKIILGPICKQTETDIQNLLNDNGYDFSISILKSKIPYRE